MSKQEIPLKQIVEEWLLQMKNERIVEQHITVVDVTMNHPTDLTEIVIYLSDKTTANLGIQRPIP